MICSKSYLGQEDLVVLAEEKSKWQEVEPRGCTVHWQEFQVEAWEVQVESAMMSCLITS